MFLIIKLYDCLAGSCAPLDDTWKRYRDFCYFVTSESEANGATWRQARLACQNHGADLASIRDIQENNFILSMVCVYFSLFLF